MEIKLIKRDDKEFYGNFGGHLVEATIDNIEVDLDSQRRVLNSVEMLFKRHQKELTRLENIYRFLFRNKYINESQKEQDGNE